MIRLRPLKEGARIGIAAPAGPFVRSHFLRGVRNLQRAGFKVSYRQGIFAHHDHLAGDDRRRSEELSRLLFDPKIDALLIARGGSGTQRLLPALKKIAPKIVVGLSDITVLLAALWKKHRLPSLYGPMIATQLVHPRTARHLAKILTRPDALEKQRLVAKKIFRPGHARGRLVGGCLSLVVSLIGTPWEIDTKGSILFLEDVDEPPYRIDRLITHLEQAGRLKEANGIVLGTFRLGKDHFPRSIEKLLRERLKNFQGPVLWGLRFGHHPNPLILPFGGIGRIKGRRLIIEKGIF